MRRLFVVLCLLSLSLNACSSVTNNVASNESGTLPELSCVAVLPTVIAESNHQTLTAAQKARLEDGSSTLDFILSEELGTRVQFKILTEHQLDAMIGKPLEGRLLQLRAVGQATGCGAVLETSIGKHRQRVGSTMSIETPAAVAFSMELIGLEKGMVIWTTSFDETQKSLLEDIFSFSKAERRGFQWLTVEELSRDGIRNRLADFPFFQKEDE